MIEDNDIIVAMLEVYLKAARERPFGALAITMVGHPNVAAVDFCGEIALEESLREAVGLLDKKLETSIANWSLPPRNEALDASHVVYNLANGPLGFDFLVWLVDAEMIRRRENAPAPLKVGFWLGRDAEDRINRAERRLWLEKVFRPALALIGAVENETAIHGHHKPVFVPRDIVAAARRGETVPRFKSGLPPRHPGAVTITLREAAYWQNRNSDLDAWLKFARAIARRGEKVIVVRDTAKAAEPFHEFDIDPEASVDLTIRMALYENAKANLFVANGPATLAVFSDRPWLMFVPPEDDDSLYAPNTRKFWKEMAGIELGGQYPWSGPHQRLVWAPDEFDEIMRAWDDLIENRLAA